MDINLFNLNFNNLKYFYEVCKLGSFTKASEYFCISQPSISYAIKQLEDHFGEELIIRNRNGIKMTKIGSLLFVKVEEIINSMNECHQIMENKKETEQISFGMQSHIYLFFKNRIKSFIKENPNVKLIFHDDSTAILINKLENKEIDFIIDTAPISINSNDYDLETIKLEKMCFVYAKESHSLFYNVTNLEDISKFQIVLPRENSNIRNSLNLLLNKENLSLTPFYQSNSTQVTIDLIIGGNVIGYVFESAVKDLLQNGKLCKIPINIKLPSIPLCLVTKKENNNSKIKSFIDYLSNNKEK